MAEKYACPPHDQEDPNPIRHQLHLLKNILGELSVLNETALDVANGARFRDLATRRDLEGLATKTDLAAMEKRLADKLAATVVSRGDMAAATGKLEASTDALAATVAAHQPAG